MMRTESKGDSADIESGSVSRLSCEVESKTIDDEYCCRICLEPGQRKDYIAPCGCKGTSKWVHRACLDKWRSVREDVAFAKCTECKVPYKLKALHDDSWSSTCFVQSKFFGLVLRDILIALATWQLIVCALAAIVFMCDVHSSLIIYFNMSSRVAEFYYGAGLVSFFGVVGLVYVSGNTCCTQDTIPCDCGYAGDPMCWWFWSDGIGMGSPHFYCYNCDCCGGMGSGLAVQGCDCAACCNGECCTCAAMGEEVFAVFLMILVLLVLLGLVVSVVVGAMYISFVMQRHVKVLKKWNLAKEYIVVDLCENEVELPVSDENSVLINASNSKSSNSNKNEFGVELMRRMNTGLSRYDDLENQNAACSKPMTIERGQYEEVPSSITNPILDESNFDYDTHPSAPQLTRRQFSYLRSSGLL